MATPEQVEQFDSVLETVAEQFAEGLTPLFDGLFDSIATAQQPSRLYIQQQMQPLVQYAQAQSGQLETVVDAAVALNSDVTGSTVTPTLQAQLPQLTQEVTASLEAQILEEQNSIINSVAMATLVGTLTAQTLSELRELGTRAAKRLSLRWRMATRNLAGAVTLLQGRSQPTPTVYEYVGGVVAESRDFCRRNAGRRFTEQEIRNTWSSQTWQGKQPGDPFVVRGGYNCRHTFVAVAEEE